MKLMLVFTIAILVHGLVDGQSSTLKQDLDDFIELLPQQQLVTILLDHLSNDSEMLEVVQYIMTDDFQNIVTTAESLPEFQELIQYLHVHGIDIQTIIDLIHGNRTGLPRVNYLDSIKEKKTLKALLAQIASIIPEASFQQLYQTKIDTSPDFRDFVEHLQSPEFQVIVNTVKSMPEFHNLVAWLLAKDVDLQQVVDYLKSLFTGN